MKIPHRFIVSREGQVGDWRYRVDQTFIRVSKRVVKFGVYNRVMPIRWPL